VAVDGSRPGVSHLAGEIREAAEATISVDGIEAEGLVDGELQVDRSPVKGRLARSTPELIVEKLAEDRAHETARKGADETAEWEFYASLLRKF
jgi:DNA mismatch repair protein MutS2